ncbi:alpha-amylase [Terrihabitans soli]|uniref:Alpha-amylase n=1 Tax=Terrihabitans soli TaxID=708113 RepID=A0A6S6QLE7_9HYPH|nr:alpha-amylase family glycosyl hydrolase [Terrihabitans soli]BCJ89699.1 alpha-amylase [Terrihabitans soli]
MHQWWQTGVIYQVYPRSFQDTGGDGVGDIKGVTQRLDYLADLGVDAIWLSPIFVSPMADFGYDVADYKAIDPLFGTLEDFDDLVARAHKRGMKIILDLVPNHTSEQHPWFVESRSSKSNPKRDWYIWREGKDGGPPNNWISNFGGSAWQLDEKTGQYYYHAFLKEQPDLNWRNPKVREAMFDVLRFWMKRGADGFRVDVIWHLMKDPEFRDNPPNPDWTPGHQEIGKFHQVHNAGHPDVHGVIAEMRRVTDEFPDRLLIGELYLPFDKLMAYYGRNLSGVQLPFNFSLLETKWDAEEIAGTVEEYEKLLPKGAWPNWVLGNHDRERIAAKIGQAQARIAAMLLFTLRGTPTLYYGDEIGIGKVDIPADMIQDPWEKREPGIGLGRDPVRTPMQWESSRYAGFSTGTPWLPLTEDWTERNVAALEADFSSIFHLHRDLLHLRRKSSALQTGSYRTLCRKNGVFAFERRATGERLAVILNMTHEPRRLTLSEDILNGKVLLATDGSKSISNTLAPDQGFVIALD